MKRILSILLALLLLFSTLPMTAFAAETDTAETGENIIDKVEVTAGKAVDGLNPSYEASTPEGAPYAVHTEFNSGKAGINGVTWLGDNGYLDPEDTFEQGKNYTVRVFLKPVSDDYRFADNVAVTINGSPYGYVAIREHTQSWESTKNDIAVELAMTCRPPEEIKEVELTVYPPIIGIRPTYEAIVPDGALYRVTTEANDGYVCVNGVSWMNGRGFIKTTHTFEPDETYTVRVILKPVSPEYRFAEDVKIRINGSDDAYVYNKENVWYYKMTDEIAAERLIRSTPADEISSVAISGFEEPVAGSVPVTAENLTLGSEDDPAHYSVTGVIWKYKNSDGSFTAMKEGEAFLAGKEYQARINLKSDYKNGYNFPRDEKGSIKSFDSVTINGSEELVDADYSYVLSDRRQLGLCTKVMTADIPRGTTGDCEWEFDPALKVMLITGDGRMADYARQSQAYNLNGDPVYVERAAATPWQEYKNEISIVMIDDGVINVGKYAFDGCSELETVLLGSDVESIGNGAFRGTAISEIDLSMHVLRVGDEAFSNCAYLSSVKMNDQFESIGKEAFAGTDLTSLNAPNSTVVLNDKCFGYDSRNYKINGFTIYGVPGSTAEEYADENGFTFVSVGGVTGDCWWTFDRDTSTLTIGGNGAMGDCEGEEFAPWVKYLQTNKGPWNLVFEGDITHIGVAAFMLLPIEGNVTIPASCTSIGANAFQSCDRINGISLESVKEIGNYAFSGCTNLYSVNLESAEYIGVQAFCNCENLSGTYFGENLRTIDDQAFSGCKNIMDLNFPKSLSYISAGAFENCYSLSGISFPNGSQLIVIDSEAFSGCDLRTVEIPDSVTAIRDSAFMNNYNLEWLTLSKALETVGANAFLNTNVSEVTIHGAVCEIGEHAFGYNSSPAGEGYVPVGSLNIFGLIGSAAEEYAATEDSFHFIVNDMNEGRTGDCVWYYDDTDYTLFIYGSGSMGDYDNPEDVPWYGKNSGYINVEIGENVAYIGQNCFAGVQGGIFVPDTVFEIHADAIGFDGDGEPVSGFKILGYPDTYAEEYASWYDHIRFKDVTPRPYNPDSGISGGDNIYWSFDREEGVLTIEPDNDDWTASIDDFDFTANAPWSGQGKKAPWAKYSEEVFTIVIKDGVTSIGAYAFAFMKKELHGTDLYITKDVQHIGEGAFYDLHVMALRMYNPECVIEQYAFGYGDDPETGISYTPFELTIAGYKNSTTQKYADDNDNISFYDMNTTYLFDMDSQVIVLTTEPGVELVVEKEDEANFVVVENGVVYSSYDISLQKDGEKVQPEDPVKVRLPLYGEYDENIKVYRVEADGSLTDMNAYYSDGDLIFETEHFSRYIVVYEEPIPEITEPENPIILGDVDGDGEVSILDATALQRHLAELSTQAFVEEASDADGDGEISILDATAIQRWLASLSANENIGKYI